jgi:hypothetical protein
MGYSGGYVLSNAESRGKAAVVARAVMLGEGEVVQVKGFGVEDNVGGSKDGLVAITVERVIHVGGVGHIAGGGGGGIGSHRVSSNPQY